MPHDVCIVVDDEPAVRKLLRSVLEKRRLQVLEAGDALSAWNLIQSVNGCLDFVISDIRMPGDMNGVDLAHSVRGLFPSIPVILISGYSDACDGDSVAFECIPKPFMPETILESVDRAISSREVPAR